MAWKKPTESQCLPPGEYDAEITAVDQATSKKGRSMVVMTYSIDYDGKRKPVKDWIVAGTSFAKPKVEAIAAALGKSAELEAKTFRLSEQLYQPIRVLITRENDPNYGWKNRLDKYMTSGLGMGPDIPPVPGQSTETYPDPMDPDMPF